MKFALAPVIFVVEITLAILQNCFTPYNVVLFYPNKIN
jgi:hypothetical protein